MQKQISLQFKTKFDFDFQPKAGWSPSIPSNPTEFLGLFPPPPLAAGKLNPGTSVVTNIFFDLLFYLPELCQILPPPDSFHGPFVMVDKLMEVIVQMNLPNEFPGIWLRDNSKKFKHFNYQQNCSCSVYRSCRGKT